MVVPGEEKRPVFWTLKPLLKIQLGLWGRVMNGTSQGSTRTMAQGTMTVRSKLDLIGLRERSPHKILVRVFLSLRQI